MTNVVTKEVALCDSENYFNGDTLAADVFVNKYALRNKDNELLESNPDQMHKRIAKEFARIEKKKFKKPFTEDFIYNLLKDFSYIIPQGSILAGLGSENYVTLSNCYVVEKPTDSYSGIHYTDEQLTQISKRRGGVGIDISNLRPDGTKTTNAARTSTGIVPFCERYSNSIREVGQSARRGALMITISIHHPEILNFIEMKSDASKVTGANISVRLTNEFMKAVDENKDYELRFPVDSKNPIFSKMVSAEEIWRKIIYNAWLRAEPGLLFWDHIIRQSPADCYREFGFETISTNPCGELPLCSLDSCRLLLLNLFKFVKKPFAKDAYFDFVYFKEIAGVAQRLMDDIIDLELEHIDRIIDKINKDPEPDHIKSRELNLWNKIKVKCFNGRRTGTGITALGDALAALGIKYGSEDSIYITEDIYKTLKHGCYRSSVDIAKENGPFPIWNHTDEKDNEFLLRIKDEDSELYGDMKKYGRSNIACLTTAPAGTISIECQTTSGFEPLFTDVAYTRRKKINPSDNGKKPDFIDNMGDKWEHFEVMHPKIKIWMDITGETDYKKSPYHGACAEDIDWENRVKMQAVATKHIDHSISSTINLPENISKEEVADIYLTAWKSGCKGITVYRKNCRTGVLVDNEKVNETKIRKNAPKRPTSLPCEIHKFKVNKEPFVVLIGILNGEPYEVFAFEQEKHGIIKDGVNEAFIYKVKRGKYELRNMAGDNLFDGESLSGLLNDEQEAITRLVSASLRHLTPLPFLVEQLEKTKGEMNSFAKSIARALKKFIKDGEKVNGESCPDCQQDSLIRAEGCVRCRNCSFSRCS